MYSEIRNAEWTSQKNNMHQSVELLLLAPTCFLLAIPKYLQIVKENMIYNWLYLIIQPWTLHNCIYTQNHAYSSMPTWPYMHLLISNNVNHSSFHLVPLFPWDSINSWHHRTFWGKDHSLWCKCETDRNDETDSPIYIKLKFTHKLQSHQVKTVASAYDNQDKNCTGKCPFLNMDINVIAADIDKRQLLQLTDLGCTKIKLC